MAKSDNAIERFGWSSGEAWIELEDGSKVRLGEIPESAKDYLKEHKKEDESKSGAMDKLFRKIGIRK
jgi:hypothetical protein